MNTKVITGIDVVNKAREYLGTPYVHQGRQKGVGIDCIGTPLCVGWELGLAFDDHDGYSKQPTGLLHKKLREILISTKSDEPGVILEMRWKGDPQHVAIRTDYGLIHTYNGGALKVVETRLDEKWSARITGRYKIPGVSYEHGQRTEL